MSHHLRRAYIDTDTLYLIGEAVNFLADLRGIDEHPATGALADPDLLHLLASLILHAQTWLQSTIEQILADDAAWLTQHDIDHILAGVQLQPNG